MPGSRQFGQFIAVEGVGRLVRLFRLTDASIPAYLGARNKAIGEKVVARAEQLSPFLSGDLQGSGRAGSSAREVTIRWGGTRAGAVYAPIIHWGSRYRPDEAPRPFVAEAAHELHAEITRDYEDAINDAMSRFLRD